MGSVGNAIGSLGISADHLKPPTQAKQSIVATVFFAAWADDLRISPVFSASRNDDDEHEHRDGHREVTDVVKPRHAA